jgi:hypothetical protein
MVRALYSDVVLLDERERSLRNQLLQEVVAATSLIARREAWATSRSSQTRPASFASHTQTCEPVALDALGSTSPFAATPKPPAPTAPAMRPDAAQDDPAIDGGVAEPLKTVPAVGEAAPGVERSHAAEAHPSSHQDRRDGKTNDDLASLVEGDVTGVPPDWTAESRDDFGRHCRELFFRAVALGLPTRRHEAVRVRPLTEAPCPDPAAPSDSPNSCPTSDASSWKRRPAGDAHSLAFGIRESAATAA